MAQALIRQGEQALVVLYNDIVGKTNPAPGHRARMQRTPELEDCPAGLPPSSIGPGDTVKVLLKFAEISDVPTRSPLSDSLQESKVVE